MLAKSEQNGIVPEPGELSEHFLITLLRDFKAEFLSFLLRFLPLSAKTGLYRLGNPDRNAPVLVTGNYLLTVSRVRRAWRHLDAYLLIANSHGINIWCAATGGFLTHHEIISAVKTSGVTEQVDHRNLILPQLAATGVEMHRVTRSTGWHVIWGPVYAKDVPQFLRSGQKKSPEMRVVKFPFSHRLEMATVWAFPASFIVALIMRFIWPAAMLPMAAFTWGLALALFLGFPLFQGTLYPGVHIPRWLPVEFSVGGFQLLLLLLTAGSMLLLWNMGLLPTSHPWRAVGFTCLMALVLSVDILGSTPVLKSGTHPDRHWQIILDPEVCKGAKTCLDVCPKNCFDFLTERKIAMVARPVECIQCGACIVQCPFDALYFLNDRGFKVAPETVRKFKLNLLGKRAVKI